MSHTELVLPPKSILIFERVSTALAVGWPIMLSIFFIVRPVPDLTSLRFALMLVAIVVPAISFATAALLGRIFWTMQMRLPDIDRSVIGLSRHVADIQSANQAKTIHQQPIQQKAPPARIRQAGPSGFTSRRQVSRLIEPQPAPQPSDQQKLPLGTPSVDTDPPLDRSDLIRALNFPDNEQDTEGFAALRRTLRDRNARKLIQASQDVLTLLSQDGIYMDDLRPDPSTPQVWRSFAKGERGLTVETLGAIRDKPSLALATARMREDMVFRDTVLHFLRKFDQILVTFEPYANDTDLMDLSETRTARAFMLMGRVAGTFD